MIKKYSILLAVLVLWSCITTKGVADMSNKSKEPYVFLYTGAKSDFIKFLKPTLVLLGFTIENDAYRSHHLIGIEIPDFVNIEHLKMQFSKHNIYVSIRGNYIRVAPHLYNVKDDFSKLVICIKSIIN